MKGSTWDPRASIRYSTMVIWFSTMAFSMEEEEDRLMDKGSAPYAWTAWACSSVRTKA
jgi:hypothetical protein